MGNDLVYGGGGGDTLIGEGGNDQMIAGPGFDALAPGRLGSASNSQPVMVDLAAGTAVFAGDTSTISGFEQVYGGAANDDLRGDDLPNAFQARGGDDNMQGRGGDDVLDGGSPNDDDTADGGDGHDLCYARTTTNCEITRTSGTPQSGPAG